MHLGKLYIMCPSAWTQSKCTKRWKQSSAIKQLLGILFLAIKMYTGFTTAGICMNTMCAVSLVNHFTAVADMFRPLRTHQCYWTTEMWTSPKWSPSSCWHTACGESWKYILEHNGNAQNDGNKAQCIKQLLETLFLTIKMCIGFTIDGICMNTMCAVSLTSHLRAVADVFRPLRTH